MYRQSANFIRQIFFILRKFIVAKAPIKNRHILNISNGIAYIDANRINSDS